MTMNTITRTAVPCPTWCTTDHSDVPPGAGFHATSLHEGTGPVPPLRFNLWLTDREGARPSVVIGGQTLTEAQAHELGLDLVRAAEVLRRARTETSR